MATATAHLHVHADSKFTRYASNGMAQLWISAPDELYASSGISFGSGPGGQYAPTIASIDRTIEELQALRAEMLRQAVATDPAYAEVK